MSERPSYLTAQELAAIMPAFGETRFEAFSFGGFSEPFDNPEIVGLLEIAREAERVDQIRVYTNGEALTADLLRRLAHIRFDYVDVSCHALEAEVYRRTRPFLDVDKVRRNLHYLMQNRDNIAELTISVGGPFDSTEQLAQWEALCQRHAVGFYVHPLHSRAGLVDARQPQQRHAGPFRCRKHDFGKPVLLPGGDLSLCCQDFSLACILGNLHRQSFAEIMADSPVRRHVLGVAEGKEEDTGLACYRCLFCDPV